MHIRCNDNFFLYAKLKLHGWNENKITYFFSPLTTEGEVFFGST